MRSRKQTCFSASGLLGVFIAQIQQGKPRKQSDATEVSFSRGLDEVHPASTSTKTSHLKLVFTVVQLQEAVC